MTLPRYTIRKKLKDGSNAYYWNCPSMYRKQNCPFTSVPLGMGLSEREIMQAAEIWNKRLDDWLNEKNPLQQPVDTTRYGTVEWLVAAYLKHDSFLENVGEFSRPDYKRILDRVVEAEIVSEATGKAFVVGKAKINQIGVSTAQSIYKHFVSTPRSAEKVFTYCKAMWKRMRPHHPDLFRSDTPNPWEGVTLKKRKKVIKGHVDRDTVYAFATMAVENGRGELAAAAVLAFEWLMRPSSIGAGFASWGGYRGAAEPDKIIIGHRKNEQRASHPLEYIDDDGEVIHLYPQAEAILGRAPRYGLSIVCQASGKLFGDGTRLSQEIRALADNNGFPDFTLDKARHGGMTELEERGLTEGQGRVLSKHKTASAYRGYAKETDKRVLEATKKRMGHSEAVENRKEINRRK